MSRDRGVRRDSESGQSSPHPSTVFCRVCDNMMVPKEHATRKVLLNYCRNCCFSEVATNPLVWLHKIINDSDTLQYMNTDLAKDPTLAVSFLHACPKCLHRNVNYHEPESFHREHEMNLYFICRVCKHKWPYSPRGEQESIETQATSHRK